MKHATIALLLFAISAPAAHAATLTPTPVGPPVSPTLERLWPQELANIRNQTGSFKFRAWTFDAVFNAANGDKVVVSVFQGPACDNGANDKNGAEVPPLCPARIARVAPSGEITSLVNVPYVCNAGFFSAPGGPSTRSGPNQTIADFNAQTGEVVFNATYHGQPWSKPLGSLSSCRVRASI